MNLIIRYRAGKLLATIGRLEIALSGPGLAQAIQTVMTTPTRDTTRSRFAAEGGGDIPKWAPLTEHTIRMRESQGFGAGPINVRTGDMRAWATGGQFSVEGSGPSWVKMRYPDSSPSGLLERKVRTAQAGDAKSNTPARPILSWAESDLEALMIGMAAWMEGVMSG